MSQIKYTKSELRIQQNKLIELQRYLPTLQLKKAMLQTEVNEARSRVVALEEQLQLAKEDFFANKMILSESLGEDIEKFSEVLHIQTLHENVAGVDLTVFKNLSFPAISYNLFDTSPWLDGLILKLRKSVEAQVKLSIMQQQFVALEKELRQVSIRVNLFEKILIPRTASDIKRIKIFLGDQELAAVSRAKVAKKKLIIQAEALKQG